MSRKAETPEADCELLTNTDGRRVARDQTLAMRLRIWKLNRQSSRGRFSWLWVSNKSRLFARRSAGGYVAGALGGERCGENHTAGRCRARPAPPSHKPRSHKPGS